MGCYKLHNYTTLRIAHTSNTARSREGKSDAGLYKYRFENKEWQDELGLNWFDFGGRNYMPDIVRTPIQDPLQEKFYSMSSYSFLNNNPLFFTDPTGKQSDWHRNSLGVLVADYDDTAESLAEYTGMSLQEARAEFNHNHYHYEDRMFGGEKFYNSPRAVSSGDYGPSYGPEKDLKYSLVLTGAIALPILASEGLITSGLSYIYRQSMIAWSKMSVGTYSYGVAANTVSQGIANGGDLSKVNLIEAGLSGVPGLGSTVLGETFNFNIAQSEKGIQTPESIDHAVLQIGGGLISNKFGDVVDSKNLGKGVGKVYGEVAKFAVETGSNVAPSLADKVKGDN